MVTHITVYLSVKSFCVTTERLCIVSSKSVFSHEIKSNHKACILKLLTLCILINLLSFAKPNRCTCNEHNCIVFYHSKKFLHFCSIPKELLHQVLYIVYIYIYIYIYIYMCVCVWGGEAGKREQTSWTT